MQLSRGVLDRGCEVLQREQETWLAVIPPAEQSRAGDIHKAVTFLKGGNGRRCARLAGETWIALLQQGALTVRNFLGRGSRTLETTVCPLLVSLSKRNRWIASLLKPRLQELILSNLNLNSKLDLTLELTLLWVGSWTRDLQRTPPAQIIPCFGTVSCRLCCVSHLKL